LRCGSLERHRFLVLIGTLLRAVWIAADRTSRVSTLLEIAPSTATRPFRALFDHAVTIDADPAADGRVVDMVASLTGLPCANGSVDALVALHVLEHIPDDRQAMAEIHRVLTGKGVAVLQVPLSTRATTDEEPLSSAEERKARYGQADHVRLYGADFFDRLTAAGLRWIKVSPRECMAGFSVTKYRLAPDEALVFAVRADAPLAIERLSLFDAALRQGREQAAAFE
jgi:SAM-dependent methyltransferase